CQGETAHRGQDANETRTQKRKHRLRPPIILFRSPFGSPFLLHLPLLRMLSMVQEFCPSIIAFGRGWIERIHLTIRSACAYGGSRCLGEGGDARRLHSWHT